jgi:hypothetical protein
MVSDVVMLAVKQAIKIIEKIIHISARFAQRFGCLVSIATVVVTTPIMPTYTNSSSGFATLAFK